ncbi:hypothetical protein AVEN_140181-1 [Araneus ventricosus]|uniref:Uncharacterized protein n=1 Tax=Araneus ventricosus TaxID=182803 RepID=A0A4Y2X848_ARAVE|nr:hypothetical protein AVEN_73834-1 [Araneus ventricosus]GBO44347.1 hypothetical protein AVEN_140181-1 [Araneus ventricosus]
MVHQFIETGIEEIWVQVSETLNSVFLEFSIGSEMATCQVLLQQFPNRCAELSSTSTTETLEHPPYIRDLESSGSLWWKLISF